MNAQPIKMISRLVLFAIIPSVLAHKDGSCKTCKDIAKNFEKGIESTAKSNFGGGNTNWEEKSLGSYAFSETRFIEIMEGICDHEGKDCHSMLEKHEEQIEDWWFKYYAKDKPTKLEKYLCINTIQVCCPKGTYGKNCLECTGGKARPCKGNGKCSGDGTRTGTGECTCDAGYKGQICDECKDDYFEETKNNTHTVCAKCDESCDGGCTDTGPNGCNSCKEGWHFMEETGCSDINECASEGTCGDNEYCTNSPGSHRCTRCHLGCKMCTVAGSDNCVGCSELYIDVDGKCEACHQSCANSCTDTTSMTCDSCTDGWEEDDDVGCRDIDECAAEQSPCSESQYCTNNDGSYHCSNCHAVCDGCTGSGIRNCIECTKGYAKNEMEECKDIDECENEAACGENERCINTVSSFRCECKDGFIRKHEDCEPRAKPKTKKKKVPTATLR